MPGFLNETQIEDIVMSELAALGLAIARGADISPDGEHCERATYADVVLVERLREALSRINPQLPASAIEEAIGKVRDVAGPNLIESNRKFHRLLVDGVPVDYRNDAGDTIHDFARLIDRAELGDNDWLAVRQFTVKEAGNQRRPDVVVFVNGLPLAAFELKSPEAEQATVRGAFNQFETYKNDIPSLLVYNAFLVISDGIDTRMGTITSEWERFVPWKTEDGKTVAPATADQLGVLLRGVFDRARLVDLIREFIVFEDDGQTIQKKVAAYHQFHAVNKAIDETVRATRTKGDRKIGVVWHTQGSGKSLSMVFYAGKVIQHAEMNNPTLVVLTDRNDLDDQLFGTFSRCSSLLRQSPVQADSRAHLRDLLSVASGGVIFTTIQKFAPEDGKEANEKLSDRKNIVVIADEAHRSQYGFAAKFNRDTGTKKYGLAQHMREALPHASFIGFTGTPIEQEDKSTPAVFGNYIDIYDIQRAVEDGATVKIYYESRLAKLELNEDVRPTLDPDFDEITEAEEAEVKERLKSKWARLEAMVGTEKRIATIAADIIDHFERRTAEMPGKAMIVAMSRRICVDLYDAIVKLRPRWHSTDDDKGVIKVVMTGAADDRPAYQPHIRNKAKREALAKRFKDEDSDFKIVIVRDMWLTGFDAPCLHTMYADKPMKGHSLMQAIARVNRVFRDKPGGLVVDYLGLADQLKQAMVDYSSAGGKGDVQHDISEAIDAMQEKLEVVRAMFHGFPYLPILTAEPKARIAGMAAAMDFILGLDNGKERYIREVALLSPLCL